MSLFSECFVRLKDKRNLTGAQIAERCGRDKSHIFYWLVGKKFPKDWKNLEEIIQYMQLFPSEEKELRNAYEKTKYGEEAYKYYEIFFEIIKSLQERRNEYTASFMKEKGKVYSMMEFPDMIRLENKLEIVSEIQRVLEYMETRKKKRLYIKMRTFQPEVLMLLKLFCAKVEDCHMILIVSLSEDTAENTLRNLEIWKDALEIIVQKNDIDVFVSEAWNGREELGANWILSNEFAIQFDVDCTVGMLYTQLQWLEFFEASFQKLKQESKYAGNRKISIEEWLPKYKGNRIIGNSIGYMPFVLEGAGKEENIHIQWKNYFCYEGLQEFMETGWMERYSDEMNCVMEMQERCVVLRNMIQLMENGEIQYHIISEAINMKNIYLEQVEGSNPHFAVEISMKDGMKERYVIEGAGFQQKFKEFFEYLKEEGYVWGAEESLKKMREMLNKMRENLK